MIEDNNRMLEQFFSEAAQQQIADNGFTERVMAQLPSRINWLTRLWTLFCLIVFGVWFVAFDGAGQLAIRLEVLLRTLAVETWSVNLTMLLAVTFGLLFVGVGEVISSERARR